MPAAADLLPKRPPPRSVAWLMLIASLLIGSTAQAQLDAVNTGLSVEAFSGIGFVEADAWSLDGQDIPASGAGQRSGFNLGYAPSPSGPWRVLYGMAFTQSEQFKLMQINLGAGYGWQTWPDWWLELGVLGGLLRTEYSHVALTSLFGSAKTKALQVTPAIALDIAFAWRPWPYLAVVLAGTWSQPLRTSDTWSNDGHTEEIPDLDVRTGGLSLRLGVRFHIYS